MSDAEDGHSGLVFLDEIPLLDSALRAHRQIRHLNRNKPNLDCGASPRRPLKPFGRPAHLLALGKEIDQADAMRTRRTELY